MAETVFQDAYDPLRINYPPSGIDKAWWDAVRMHFRLKKAGPSSWTELPMGVTPAMLNTLSHIENGQLGAADNPWAHTAYFDMKGRLRAAEKMRKWNPPKVDARAAADRLKRQRNPMYDDMEQRMRADRIDRAVRRALKAWDMMGLPRIRAFSWWPGRPDLIEVSKDFARLVRDRHRMIVEEDFCVGAHWQLGEIEHPETNTARA